MSEIKRLREALKEVESRAETIQAYGIRDIAREALSSPHREDGIQKVRELYALYDNSPCFEVLHQDYKAGVRDTLNALGYLVPGITKERSVHENVNN